MNLDDFLKKSGIATADKTAPKGMFPLETVRYLNTTVKVRKGIGKFINPKNAAEVVNHLPKPGSYTLGMVGGNFVFGDIIPHFVQQTGRKVTTFACSTLSLSVKNAEMLIAAKARAKTFLLWVSHYFVNCDKGPHAVAVQMLFDADIDLRCSRTHAKIILIHSGSDYYVIEGSANLRSSGNAEQLIILNSREAFEFRLQNLYELENLEIDREAIKAKIAAAQAEKDAREAQRESDRKGQFGSAFH